VITVEELRSIRILSELPDGPLVYLSGAVEDIRVAAGEYFANEGDERALFVVVEGRAEITKVVAGEERVIGTRKPGQFFGEVPMTLSAPFPASGRAAVASRIIKLDTTVYYTLAALAPVVPARVAGLARRYLESLQELAVEQPDSGIRLIGPRHDARTHQVAEFLARNQIGFVRDVSDASDDGAGYPVLQTSADRLVAPSMRGVAAAVGLHVQSDSDEYDVAVLGGGPAGLTAAVNAAAEGLRTVVIESLAPGGQAGTSSRIENYTGFPFGISGDDLASRALKQAKRLGAEIVVTRTVEALRPDRNEIALDGGDLLRAPVVVLATGVEWRTLPVPSIGRFLGNGVYYGAARSDASIAQGADLCIVGAGNSAGQAALFFARRARSVTMIVRGASLGASMSRYLIDQIEANDIRVETGREIVGLGGAAGLETVDVLDRSTGEVARRACSVLLAAARGRARRPRLRADRPGRRGDPAVDGRPPAVRPRDERSRCVRGRGCAIGFREAGRRRSRRGRHGRRLRAPVPRARPGRGAADVKRLGGHRTDRKPVLSSSANRKGCSHAAKCPPASTWL
jgi:thioredoxin reductase (NADPH)